MPAIADAPAVIRIFRLTLAPLSRDDWPTEHERVSCLGQRVAGEWRLGTLAIRVDVQETRGSAGVFGAVAEGGAPQCVAARAVCRRRRSRSRWSRCLLR